MTKIIRVNVRDYAAGSDFAFQKTGTGTTCARRTSGQGKGKMAEGQAKWKGMATKENPRDTIPKQGMKDQAFSSQEAAIALCAASPTNPGHPHPLQRVALQDSEAQAGAA